MKKVLLINPEDSRSKINFDGIIVNEPLDLEVIYTNLINNNIKVDFYDFLVREKISLKEKIIKYKPDYICACGVVHQIPFIIEYFELAKSINKNIKTIVTGSYSEYNYKDLSIKCVDYIMRSYDPSVISDVILDKNLSTLNGLCYKNKNKWFYNKLTYFDINKLPITNRKHFYKYKDTYRYLELEGATQIRTSYSCPFNCSFCYRTTLNNNKYVAKDIIKVVDEIQSIKSDIIYFVDDDFLFNNNRIKKFIKEIKRRNINKKYICYGRCDYVLKNKDIIKELKEIGFYYILIGLESIDNNNLNNYNKLTNENANSDCVKFLNEIGINIMGMFIIDINFKRKDFKNLYNWICKNNVKHVALSIYTPLPGSKLYEKEKSNLITNDLTKWDYINLVLKPTNISIRKFYLYYYILVIKLFKKAKKENVYSFIDFKKFKKEFLKLVIK